MWEVWYLKLMKFDSWQKTQFDRDLAGWLGPRCRNSCWQFHSAQTRSFSTWGGVCIFLRQDLTCNPRPDLGLDDLESIWLEIILPKTKPFLLSTCYRPPNHSGFYDYLENNLESNNIFRDIEIILMGGFNTDVTVNKKILNASFFKSFTYNILSGYKVVSVDNWTH